MNSSDNRLAARYAKAYYNAKGPASDKKIGALSAVYNILQPVLNEINSPLLSISAKQEILSQVLASYKNEPVYNFTMLLANVKRLYLFGHIMRQAQLLYDKENSLNQATVTTAKELTGEQLAAIKTRLETMLNLKLQITQQTDAQLIGGVKVKIGDLQIDGSLQGQLARLKTELI